MDTATLFKSTTIAVDAEHRGLAQAQKREAGMFDDIVGVSAEFHKHVFKFLLTDGSPKTSPLRTL